MRISTLYQPSDYPQGKIISLDERASHYLLHVLRLKRGTVLRLFDGEGHFAEAKLVECQRKGVKVKIQHTYKQDNRSPLHLHLYQGVCRGEKMDLVVQKATELGVSIITPVLTQYAQAQRDKDRQHNRLQHWQQVMISAAEQSGRSHLPSLQPFISLADINVAVDTFILEPQSETAISKVALTQQAAIVVGPEGGFSEDEITHLKQHGCQTLSMGPRVLRSETAGLAAIAVMQSLVGDF